MSVLLNGAPATMILATTGFIYRVGMPAAQFTRAYWDQALEFVGAMVSDPLATDKEFESLEGATEPEARFAAMATLAAVTFVAQELYNADNP